MSRTQGEFSSRFDAQTRHRPCGGCRRIAATGARAALDAARRDHLAALRDAIACGVPLPELAQDCEAAAKAMRDVIALAGEGGA